LAEKQYQTMNNPLLTPLPDSPPREEKKSTRIITPPPPTVLFPPQRNKKTLPPLELDFLCEFLDISKEDDDYTALCDFLAR